MRTGKQNFISSCTLNCLTKQVAKHGSTRGVAQHNWSCYPTRRYELIIDTCMYN